MRSNQPSRSTFLWGHTLLTNNRQRWEELEFKRRMVVRKEQKEDEGRKDGEEKKNKLM